MKILHNIHIVFLPDGFCKKLLFCCRVTSGCTPNSSCSRFRPCLIVFPAR
ncbi:hypothetical protein EVA_16636 [gut metagenome]|uniref:Uncharacterized protein n=1 Tax=gut metagenome TaxID=749906 RepID=J9FK23_9ZZZZ